MYWRVGRAFGEVAFEVKLEGAASAAACAGDGVERVDPCGVYNDRALGFHGVNGAHEHADDFSVGGGPFVCLAEDADTCAFESARFDEAVVIFFSVFACRCGDGVFGIFARDYLKHSDCVGDGSGHRAGDVRPIGEWHYARARGEPHGGADAYERVVRAGAANGVPGIRAESDFGFVGGDRGRSAAAGAGGDAIEGVGILGVAGENRAHRFVRRKSPLGEIRFGEHNGACCAHARDHGGVLVWNPPFEGERARGGLEVACFEVVFDHHRNAVECADEPFFGKSFIERICHGERVLVQGDDGVDGRP